MNRLFIENSNIILRKILNKEENLDIVKNLIESILHLKLKRIIIRPYLGTKVKYLPEEEKYGIVNVRVINENEKEFNVGIQIIDGFYMQEKLITYAASIHVNQIEYEDHKDTTDTLTINILDFKGFGTPAHHKVVTFFERDNQNNVEMRDEIKLHVLELPSFTEAVSRTPEEEWIQYFKGDNTELIDKIKERNPAINKLDEKLKAYWKNEDI